MKTGVNDGAMPAQPLLSSDCLQSLKSDWMMLMQGLNSIQHLNLQNTADQRHQLARLAYTIGCQCQDPASAFLAGYQMAVRCVDPDLKPNQWGAFCINERGVTSLQQMSTIWQPQEQWLSGQKSFALMAGQGLDSVVVIARSHSSSQFSVSDSIGRVEKSKNDPLVAVKIDLPADNVGIIAPQKPAKILPALPHSALLFDRCPAKQLICREDAHNRLNKPFRFWEDIMVTLSFSGWIRHYLTDQHGAEIDSLSQQLIQYFAQSFDNYDRHSMALVEQLHQLFFMVERQLPQDQLVNWQRDKQILTLVQPLRDRIKKQLG